MTHPNVPARLRCKLVAPCLLARTTRRALGRHEKNCPAPRLATGLGAGAQEARPQNLSENVKFDFGNAASEHSQRFGG
jgi:hypothetical protein